MGKPAIRIVLKPLLRHHARGMAQGRKIWVDPRTPWPAHTLLHELIHVENPSWSETAVLRETARRWRKMSWQEKAELLKLLGTARIGDEGED